MNKGKFGEDFTAKYLKKNGFNVIERNYHSRYGEIDIIAINNKFIVFVEVKTRSKRCGENPAVFVDKKKQKKIIITAQKYFNNLPSYSDIFNLQPRFDISAIVINDDKPNKIAEFDYFEDCFYANL